MLQHAIRKSDRTRITSVLIGLGRYLGGVLDFSKVGAEVFVPPPTTALRFP